MSTNGTNLVQTTKGTPSVTSSFVQSLSQPTQAGNVIVVWAYSGKANAPNAEACNGTSGNVTDDAGNSYSFLTSVAANNTAAWMFYCFGALSATQVTATYTGLGTTKKFIVVREYTNGATYIPGGEGSGSQNNGSTIGAISTSLAPTFVDEIMLGYSLNVDASGTAALTNGTNFSNYDTITFAESINGHASVAFAFADLYSYAAAGVSRTFDLTTGGTSLAWQVRISELELEGGVKAVPGSGQMGIGDGGFGVFG